ncbi:acVLRF1 family peptidyl-tRNA hydrolase [Umezawaea endophytica]|uniref:AcVLRF1 family peptidyl-tRNA hydrolase n=1 Tax=Umezawaea endophytica TaxID=1654476 RepID=A0A9X3A6D1_9PSEU|nr:acVLRF1 family peptidyl-tRNA hydrolase [Umezawaea endophytica]MCS7484694.1 acVLRF1 family peptidyl-tRNA hydrolase [Umezawaea endophytica]
MSRVRAVAGGGRAVEVEPERLAGWFDRFSSRHCGVSRTVVDGDHLVVHAVDGTRAEVDVPFPPLAEPTIAGLVEHALVPRRIGLLLVRLGGHSVGIAVNGVVEASTTDSRQVHGRNRAGGWSQQRFARRREGQARVALEAAAADAVRVLAPEVDSLDAVVLGGDRQALDVLRADRRLAAVFAKAGERVLDVAEPRRAVLDEAAVRARAVEVVVRAPEALG